MGRSSKRTAENDWCVGSLRSPSGPKTDESEIRQALERDTLNAL